MSDYKKIIDEMVWSYSRVDSFKTCKRMWKFTYLDKLEQVDNAWAIMGTWMHELMEDFANKKRTKEETLQEYKDKFYEVVPEFPPFSINLRDHYYSKCLNFFTNLQEFKQEVLPPEERWISPY